MMLWSECEWLIVTNVEGSPDNLSNVDWARKFVDITKTTWVGAYMKFYDDDSAMHQLLQIYW